MLGFLRFKIDPFTQITTLEEHEIIAEPGKDADTRIK
jgi:hypothetical protein